MQESSLGRCKHSPEELCSSSSKAHHVVRDGTEQQCLYQVVGQLNEALSQGKRQFVVHAAGTLSVHHTTLCEGHRLDSHGIDDAQEKHGQVEATQNVAQILSRLPAKGQYAVRKWWCVSTPDSGVSQHLTVAAKGEYTVRKWWCV